MKEYIEYDSAGYPHKVREREPVASPQATRPERICGNCGLPLVQDETEEICRELDKVAARLEARRAAQPAAGTTPPCCEHPKEDHFSAEMGSFCRKCPVDGNVWEHVWSEPTTPQAERMCARCGCDKATHEVEISRSGRTSGFCYAHPETCAAFEARAVAPVETPELGTCETTSHGTDFVIPIGGRHSYSKACVNWRAHAPVHRYISTACLHGNHDQCRQTCKFCKAKCECLNCVHRVAPVETPDEDLT